MEKAICGIDCGQCPMNKACGGCAATKGRPFGGSCMLALCCKSKGCEHRGKVFDASCKLEERLVEAFNGLGIEDMETVTGLNALKGSFVNLGYTLPGGQTVKFWEDDRIYLGNQARKMNSDRCYGLTADEHYLLVCEYGEHGTGAEIVTFKKWR